VWSISSIMETFCASCLSAQHDVGSELSGLTVPHHPPVLVGAGHGAPGMA
jgi:hypothetical protein